MMSDTMVTTWSWCGSRCGAGDGSVSHVLAQDLARRTREGDRTGLGIAASSAPACTLQQ